MRIASARRPSIPLALLATAALLAGGVFLSLGARREDEISLVEVTNFPETQRIRGTVTLEGPIRQTALMSLPEVDVRRQIRPDDTRALVPGGVLTTEGFRSMVLSVTGLARGVLKTEGEVGAILVPDEEPMAVAFDERGQLQFPLQVKALAGSGFFFSSSQPRFDIAFNRYRVYYYNTTDRTVTAKLYAYLTN